MNNTKFSERSVSFFEFWPSWVMYLPVGLQWIFLAMRHRSLTLPFLANPSLPLSGMVGVPKTALMKQATGKAAEVILPWIEYRVDSRPAQKQAKTCMISVEEKNIIFPFVCKPDIGCRGVGVKLVETEEQLVDIIAQYPLDANLVCQKLASYESEVGIFYVKDPRTKSCKIPSLTIKTLPRITGDGVHTLGQLIEKDPRAGQVKFLYETRHQARWNDVLSEREVVRLVFSASHSKGAVFNDAREHITPKLLAAIDEIMSDLPEFYYGRLDVKFKDIESLRKGENLQVIEINGASAESIHIWDKDTKFSAAITALLWQYRTLFQIGAYHRSKGKKTPSFGQFLSGWKLERNLTRHYPLMD